MSEILYQIGLHVICGSDIILAKKEQTNAIAIHRKRRELTNWCTAYPKE